MTVCIQPGSVLGPSVCNVFLHDSFLLSCKGEICTFADDNAIYASDQCLDAVLNDLESDLSASLQWLKQNCIVANPKEFQLMLLWLKYKSDLRKNIQNMKIPMKMKVKLVGVKVDCKLKFE